MLGGSIVSVIPTNGPLIGGNTVTITASGNLGLNDITSVLLGTCPAAITGQSSTTVTVVAKPCSTSGKQSVVVDSTFFGISTFAGYTYNPGMFLH